MGDDRRTEAGHREAQRRTSSVVIVTLDRPECVRRCLDCVTAQAPAPDQVIVVDASADTRTRDVVDAFPSVEYVRHEDGVGRMTTSRNMALKRVTGDVVVFVDDDAYAWDGWLREILATFSADVGAVGGRALRDQPGEEREGVDQIGRLSPVGTISGFFAADPGGVIEVDHVMGCNMAFRRDVLASLGGLRDDYKGVSGVREDTDICLRVKRLGLRVLFNPRAAVDHVGAPQSKGRRFDLRYDYYAQRNHGLLLVRNFGLTAPVVRRYWGHALGVFARDAVDRIRRGRPHVAAARLCVNVAGVAAGACAGGAALVATGQDPVRRDEQGRALSAALRAPDDALHGATSIASV